MLFYIFILNGLVFGFLCSWIAEQKNRNSTNWFILGAILGLFAFIALIAAPPLIKNKRIEKYYGIRDLSSDEYQTFLVEYYNIIKNEVLEKYSLAGKLFAHRNDALHYASKLHEQEINEFNKNQEIINNLRANTKKLKSKNKQQKYINITLFLLFILGLAAAIFK